MESDGTNARARPPAFETDLLNREPEARSLTKLLERVDSPFVLAIAGKWGTGKTTFFDIWEKHLQCEGIKYQRFNAWENDYHSDPLVPFIGSIAAELPPSKRKPLSEKAAKVAITMGPHLARILTSGIVNIGDDDIDKVVSDFAYDYTSKRIREYEKEGQSVDQLGKYLEVSVKGIAEGQNNYYVLIDELDRCKPTFALSFLERIKHVLNVDGLVFVLAIDQHQLYSIIRKVYGERCDPEGYLRRFVDVTYSLQEKPSVEHFVRNLYVKLELRYHDRHGDIVTWLSGLYGLPLRDIEQAVCYYGLCAPSRYLSNIQQDLFVLALILLRTYKPEIIGDIKRLSDRDVRTPVNEIGETDTYTVFRKATGDGVWLFGSDKHAKGIPQCGLWFLAMLLVHLEADETVNSVAESISNDMTMRQRARERLPSLIKDCYADKGPLGLMLRLVESPIPESY